LAGHLECVVLGQVTSGLNNIVRLLELSDGTCWTARVHIRRKTSPLVSSTKVTNEVATIQFTKEHFDIPVPRVFAYKFDENNLVGAAFVPMSCSPAASPWTLWAATGSIAVQLTSLRLPKIGTIVRNNKGRYEYGPLPGIGRPFDTATAFFEAWADSVKFKRDKETTTRMMQRGPIPAEQMVMIIENFQSQIEAISSRLSLCNEGQFPLDHGDFLHSNIMMNEDSFDITGIIEGKAHKYDQDGQPFGQELREKWRERREYIEMVRLAELKDSLLSACLSSKRSQTIAYVYGTYTSFGKLGFYDRVVEELESKE
ncbi:hypothetical protein N7467_003525, partial [Penicillium canescens]